MKHCKENNRGTEIYGLFGNTISSGLSEEKLKTFSFTGLLKERSSCEKLVTFLNGQLAGNVEDNKCKANNSCAVKTYLSKQDCSDSASVAVGNLWKEVGCQGRSSKEELKPFFPQDF